MSLSHAYGTPPDPEAAAAVLLKALDLGYTHFDTAALYGFGANEALIGRTLKHRRGEFVLATKGGMFRNAQGQREIDGRPDAITQHCDESLRRLQTDVIDVYYLHRWDKRVPVEESVGAVADLVKAGKVRTIGLSEVSAATIRKAHRVHPLAAVQTEYSLWTRNPEVAVIDACRELGNHAGRVQPAGARVPDRGAERRRCPAAQGHPPGHAALSGRALRAQPGPARRPGDSRARAAGHDGAARSRVAAGAGRAHRPDSGNDATRPSRGKRWRRRAFNSTRRPSSD